MASISNESLMQVDEPDHHDANRSMLPSPIGTPTSRQTRFGIPDKTIKFMCETLGRLVRPDDDDSEIRRCLVHVSMIVEEALSKDPEVIERLADRDEFKANVEYEGERKVIELLRDTAQKGSWLDIIENRIFFKPIPEDTEPISTASANAMIRAWDVPFKGDIADYLLATIPMYLKEGRRIHANIVNSSGTGKSRMVDEVGKKIITVPMCLRENGNRGFPPPDIALRGHIFSIARQYGYVKRRAGLANLLSSVFVILHRRLEAIASEMPVLMTPMNPNELSSHEQDERASAVRQRQEGLASAFRDLMTRHQSLEQSNAYRRNFYQEVIQLATEYEARDVGEKTVGEQNRRPYENERQYKRLYDTGKKLCEFVNQDEFFLPPQSITRPLVILAFDESQLLTDLPQGLSRAQTLFADMDNVLNRIKKFPIFSLFVSRAGRFYEPPPKTKLHPSVLLHMRPPPLSPITEVGFDDLAYKAIENTVTLERVVQTDWIAHLGRPAFGGYYDGLATGDKNQLMLFAKRKLLNGKSTLDDADEAGSFACLSARFTLEFIKDPVSYAVALTQAECHMRLILQADAAFENVVTIVGSEPLLAEAASELLKQSLANPVHHLAYHPDLRSIDRGRPGEMVAALIVMRARDASLEASAIERRWVPVSDFMQALLPPSAFETLQSSLPTFWREGEQKSFGETFMDYTMWFNHIIRVETGEMIKAEHLWKFITRGAMIVCPVNYGGVDIVLPVCVTKGNLSRDTVTAILIQVKTSDRFQCSIENDWFDVMDPFFLVFSEGRSPRPIIRVVFALGSDEAGILFRSLLPRDSESECDDSDDNNNCQGDFTSFDIWCAGLSPNTFKDIGGDLAAYKVLLDRSLRSHISDALDLTRDPILSDKAKDISVNVRQSMLAMDYLLS